MGEGWVRMGVREDWSKTCRVRLRVHTKLSTGVNVSVNVSECSVSTCDTDGVESCPWS